MKQTTPTSRLPPLLTEHLLCARAQPPPSLPSVAGEGQLSPCCSVEETEAQTSTDTQPPGPEAPFSAALAPEQPTGWWPGRSHPDTSLLGPTNPL